MRPLLTVLAVGYVTVCLTVIVLLRLRLAYWRRRLARTETESLIAEADAICEIAARVRATTPPIPAAFLAECVSNACENDKFMGL